jgi:hypothetical protein
MSLGHKRTCLWYLHLLRHVRVMDRTRWHCIQFQVHYCSLFKLSRRQLVANPHNLSRASITPHLFDGHFRLDSLESGERIPDHKLITLTPPAAGEHMTQGTVDQPTPPSDQRSSFFARCMNFTAVTRLPSA